MTERLIRPLTRRNEQNQAYERLPHVDQQIGEALGLTPAELKERLEIAPPEKGHVQEEAIAYLLRHAHLMGDRPMEDVAAVALLSRCDSFIKHWLGGLSHDDRLQAASEVWVRLYEQIFAGDDRGDYFQVRFWLKLRSLTNDVFDSSVTRINAARVERAASWDEDDDPTASVTSPDQWDEPEFAVLTDDAAREALLRIPEPARTAFVLRFYQGWQVESADKSQISISEHFGKDPRTIRNWLARAEAALAQWRAEQP